MLTCDGQARYKNDDVFEVDHMNSKFCYEVRDKIIENIHIYSVLTNFVFFLYNAWHLNRLRAF